MTIWSPLSKLIKHIYKPYSARYTYFQLTNSYNTLLPYEPNTFSEHTLPLALMMPWRVHRMHRQCHKHGQTVCAECVEYVCVCVCACGVC